MCGTDTGRAVPPFDKPNWPESFWSTHTACVVSIADIFGIRALSDFPVLGTLEVELMRLIRLFVYESLAEGKVGLWGGQPSPPR